MLVLAMGLDLTLSSNSLMSDTGRSMMCVRVRPGMSLISLLSCEPVRFSDPSFKSLSLAKTILVIFS